MSEVIHGDCLDVLRTLPLNSIDAVVTDPPYGQTNERYDRGANPLVWRECCRVLRGGGLLLSFTGSPTYHRIATDIEIAGLTIRQMWGWVYRDGLITSAWPKEGFDRLAPAMDPICYAAKGKCLLNLQREGVGEWSRPGNKDSTIGYSDRSGRHRATKAVGRWPRSIVASGGVEGFQYFVLSRTSPGIERFTEHTNEKPLPLMEWLVDKTPLGGTVLDPYCGSGTTGVACVNTRRNFIGIEIDSGYFATAEKRIAEAQAVRAELLIA